MPEVVHFAVIPDGYVLARCKYINNVTLAANVMETSPVPEGARIVIFSCASTFYADYDRPAIVPGADIADGSAPDQSPSARIIDGVKNISVISASACNVGLMFFK